MYERDKKLLGRKLHRLTVTGRLHESKHIYIFGINDRTRETIRLLRKKGIEVDGIIENDSKKHHIFCSGVRAVPFNEIEGMTDPDHIYLLHSGFWREMREQLLTAGVSRGNIILLFNRNFLNETFLARMRNIYIGKQIYRQLVKKYGDDTKLLLCPYTGTGDIYLIGTFLQQYIRKNHIQKYTLIVVNTACEKVARIFQIQNIEKLKNVGSCSLLTEYYLCCPTECRIKILNDSWGQLYTNPTEWIRGLRGMNFMVMFRDYVFHLPKDARPEQPRLHDEQMQISSLVERYGLPVGKTVMLSPYSNTLADMPDIFWEKLAEELKETGYAVVTNCDGKKEPPIKGTTAVFCPLNIAPQFVDALGGFVGIRSGFCDVISACTAKKVILYDRENYFYNSRAFEYFSLKEMGLCEDVIEYEFDHNNVAAIRHTVLDNFRIKEHV